MRMAEEKLQLVSVLLGHKDLLPCMDYMANKMGALLP